jgi:hypothetical protein
MTQQERWARLRLSNSLDDTTVILGEIAQNATTVSECDAVLGHPDTDYIVRNVALEIRGKLTGS